ncbi:hypothetical protein IT408_00800 [Candidatus Uhrbacteria bacterium]|nr:hypothetical protein [Candidatus Uhrbacteria bacterium]
MKKWTTLLKSLGFTDSESKIYLITSEMGPSSVQEIAKRADVSRVTTYAVIESLTGHGLMSSVQKGKKTYFTAEAPERLVAYMQMRMRNMESTLKEVASAVDELKLMRGGEKPVVKLFEGPEALKAIHDDVLLSKPKQVYEFGNLDEINTLYEGTDLDTFKQQLARMSPEIRGFMLTRGELKSHGKNVVNVKLSKEKYSFDGDVLVYGTKVALSTFKGRQISVLIDSHILADTMRAMFDSIKP